MKYDNAIAEIDNTHYIKINVMISVLKEALKYNHLENIIKVTIDELEKYN